VLADVCAAFVSQSAKHSEQWLMHYPQSHAEAFRALVSDLVLKALKLRPTDEGIIGEIVELSLHIASYNDACNVCALCCCAIPSERDGDTFFSVFREQLKSFRHSGEQSVTEEHRLRVGAKLENAVRYSGFKSFAGVDRPEPLPATVPALIVGEAAPTHHTVHHCYSLVSALPK
jgi:hypothetical protein